VITRGTHSGTSVGTRAGIAKGQLAVTKGQQPKYADYTAIYTLKLNDGSTARISLTPDSNSKAQVRWFQFVSGIEPPLGEK
jgi:hypothetical protein